MSQITHILSRLNRDELAYVLRLAEENGGDLQRALQLAVETLDDRLRQQIAILDDVFENEMASLEFDNANDDEFNTQQLSLLIDDELASFNDADDDEFNTQQLAHLVEDDLGFEDVGVRPERDEGHF